MDRETEAGRDRARTDSEGERSPEGWGAGGQRHAETWRHRERNTDSKAWSDRERQRLRERPETQR